MATVCVGFQGHN